MAKLNNIEALNKALFQKMLADESIVVYGEDVGFEGGVFRATTGLQKKFGKKRVWDSPLAEASIVGTAVGMSVSGLKPVVELQFAGFSFPGLQQLFVHAARYRNRTRGRVTIPLVVRMPMGGGVRALEHHSESVEALFAHIPGLKVVMPSTPYDTKGLMVAAINDPDPVIFFEPKRIYRAFKQDIPDEIFEVPIGKANVIKEGTDLTIVTYGALLHDTIKAVQNLQTNCDVELIDLRTISPWDQETVVKSVNKTGRLLVINEAVRSFSVSSEIVATISEKCFEYLRTPPRRITGYDVTIPLAKGEKYFMVHPSKIADGINQMMKFEF